MDSCRRDVERRTCDPNARTAEDDALEVEHVEHNVEPVVQLADEVLGGNPAVLQRDLADDAAASPHERVAARKAQATRITRHQHSAHALVRRCGGIREPENDVAVGD